MEANRVANTLSKTRLYSPSAIGDILRIARERARQEEQRTKKYMAEALGITVDRLTRMEQGTSQVPFEIAQEWCSILGDYTALKKIKHIYGLALPPVDPWLLQSIPNQLTNFIQQATGAVEAAKKLLHMSKQLRYNDPITESMKSDMLKHAEEVLDVQQASDCVLAALRMHWELDYEILVKNWIQEAIADRVIIPSVSQFETMRKETFFQERAGR